MSHRERVSTMALCVALALGPVKAHAVSLNQLLVENFLIDDGSGLVDPSNSLSAFECTSETTANVTISFTSPFSGSFSSSVSSDEIIDECAGFAEDDGDDEEDVADDPGDDEIDGGDDDDNGDGDGEDNGEGDDVAEDANEDEGQDDVAEEEDLGAGDDSAEVDVSAEFAASVVDANLNDVFPELFSGDVLGAFGVPDRPILLLFDPDRRAQACRDCKAKLAELQAELDREEAFQFERLDALQGLVALDQDVIAAEGLPTLDELIADNPEIDQIPLLVDERQGLVENLRQLRSDFPFLRQASGGASQNLQRDAEVLLQAAIETNKASAATVSAQEAAGLDAARKFAIAGLAAARSTGKALASGSPLAALKALVGIGVSTKKLFEAALIAEELKDLNFNLRREVEQLVLLTQINGLNQIIDATNAAFAEEAMEQQQALVDRQIEVVEAGLAAQERLVNQLRQRVNDTKELCDKLCPITTSQSSAPAFQRTASAQPLKVSSVSSNNFAFSLNLDDVRRGRSEAIAQNLAGDGRLAPLSDLPGLLGDRRFNLFASGNVTFSDDSRRLGQDGVSFSVGGGFSWLATEGVNLGLAARFTDADIDGATGSIDSQTFSLAAFAQTTVFEGINLNAIASYGDASINADIANGSAIAEADIGAEAVSVQVQASKSFNFEQVSVTPSGSMTYSHVSRDGFRLSNGQVAPGSSQESLTARGGVSVGTTFVTDDGALFITPTLSVGGFANLTDGGGGASVSGGLGLRGRGGISANLSAGFSGFNRGQDVFSLGLNLSLPLN